ncbi:hypothetical protein CRG98_047314 [Punica granatum]|uniref:Uncharacterized protein n=1 Tax=Punica granatum TaxID=22663 RepID=A0A2I0HKR4_PUNGR|nr:hypothetical protein CRG98_047314 [Punica granatum]
MKSGGGRESDGHERRFPPLGDVAMAREAAASTAWATPCPGEASQGSGRLGSRRFSGFRRGRDSGRGNVPGKRTVACRASMSVVAGDRSGWATAACRRWQRDVSERRGEEERGEEKKRKDRRGRKGRGRKEEGAKWKEIKSRGKNEGVRKF